MKKRLVIRFDGPPSHESGRFIEVELDGASVSYGEWEQDGDYWLLVLPEAHAKVAQLETRLLESTSLSVQLGIRLEEEKIVVSQLEAENERLRNVERSAGKIYRASMNASLIRRNRNPLNCFPTWWFDLCLGWLGEALGGKK